MRTYRYLAVVALIAFSLSGCNEEKAVAIQTMAGQLVESINQIEDRLKIYR